MKPIKRALRPLAAAAGALLASAAVALAVTPAHDTYIGKTSQNKDMGIKVNEDGRIKAFTLSYKAKCDDGNNYSGSVTDRDKPKSKPKHKIKQHDGEFSGEATRKEDLGNDFKGSAHMEYSGTFDTPTTASGKAKIRVTVKHGGTKVATCTKSVTWDVK